MISRRIWLRCTDDQYEFPLEIAMSANELAQMVGVTVDTINSAMSHAKKRGTKTRYHCFDISEREYKELSREE